MRSLGYCTLVVAPAAWFLGGCGGGATGSGPQSGSAQTLTVGQASVGLTGIPKATVTVSSSQVSVTGLAGAAINFVNVTPLPNLANTSLAFTLGEQVWAYSFATKTASQVGNFLTGATDAGHPSWSPSGQIVLDGGVLIYPDGSHQTSLPAPFTSWTRLQYSPDGTQIAGLDGSGNFALMNANGSGGENPLVPSSMLNAGFAFAWLNDNQLAFTEFNGDTNDELMTVTSDDNVGSTNTPLTDTTNNAITAVPNQAGNNEVIWTVDGTYNNLYFSNLISDTNALNAQLTPAGSTYQDAWPAAAPDGHTVAFYRQYLAANNGESGIYTETTTGANPAILLTDPYQTNQNLYPSSQLSWQPFPKTQQFIGSNGTYAKNASGFMYSLLGDAFASMFAFTAATPSTATMTAVSSNTGGYSPGIGPMPPLVFTLTANSITSIEYGNSFYLPPTKVPLTGAGSVIVSYDSTSGQITLVVPALETAAKPAAVGSHLVFSGRFGAVFDGKGKNLATGGASQVEIDGKTGRLVDIR